MFNKNFEKIGKDIYVYKNFVDKKHLKEILNYVDKLSEKDWYEENPDIKWMIRTNNTEILKKVREKIILNIEKDLILGSNTAFVKMKKGYAWGVHTDDYEFKDVIEKSKKYVDGKDFVLSDVSVYGTVIYFNEFKGGEIYYPKQNIEYKPCPGDLIIHGAGEECEHGVKEVLSEYRLSYSNHISKKVKVPI